MSAEEQHFVPLSRAPITTAARVSLNALPSDTPIVVDLPLLVATEPTSRRRRRR